MTCNNCDSPCNTINPCHANCENVLSCENYERREDVNDCSKKNRCFIGINGNKKNM